MNISKISRRFRHQNFFFLSLLLVCCLVAYWPLTFHLFSLKNDALNYFLPVRYQISEAIYNGECPFWSPYFNLGYPLHGDMQSGVWNPVVQIFSLFGSYTLKTLQHETLLYVFISGVSMFYLLSYFIPQKSIVFFGAASYMLCGYISDSAQFIYWICSAAFIPFVILFYYRTLVEHSFKNAVYCGFFFYLLFVTGYPGDFIIMSYLMASIFIWKLFSKEINKANFLTFLKKHFVLIIVFTLLSLPAIISYAEFFKFAQRGGGIPLDSALSNSLHPKLLFSYLTPLGIWDAPGMEATDKLERNSYIGLVGFIFFLLSFFIKTSNAFIRFSRVAVLIFLVFSFGSFGGLRTLAYYTLPLMNTFRHPANAKVFTTVFACILSSFVLQQIVYEKIKIKQVQIAGLLVLTMLVFLCCWGAFFGFSFNKLNLIKTPDNLGIGENIKKLIDHLSFSDLLLINILVQIPFVVIFWQFCLKKNSVNKLIIAAVLNSVFHVMLFQPFTVVKKDSVASIQTVLKKISPPGYAVPSLDKSLLDNSSEGFKYFDEIGVTNLYNKKIGRVDFSITPSNLLSQERFWNNEKIRQAIMLYPPFYRADSAINIKDTSTTDFLGLKRYVLLDNQEVIEAINTEKGGTTMITIEHFSPNQWDFKINSSAPGFYCLLQNNYPRWNLYVDGKKSQIHPCNISFMGFKLPAGLHNVTLKYEAIDIKIAFFISLILFVAIIGFLILHRRT